MKQLPLFLIGLFFTSSSFTQSIDDYFSSQIPGTSQKLYLHTDREYYFIGDTLWFSPYLLQADNNKLLTEDCNLYLELIDSKGRVVEEKNFILDKGMCSGYFEINNQYFAAGTYVLRAYTDRMKPFGEDAFFRKTIKINDPRNNNPVEKILGENKKTIFIDFYPEGGFLLDGKVNQMAFIAHNQDGQKINFKGQLLSSSGDQIPIETAFKGAGSFWFIPKSKQKYKIESEGSANIKFRMPEISQEGAKLMLSNISEKAISSYIIASDNITSPEFYIAIFHRGIGKNYLKIKKEDLSRAISINANYFGAGVNRLVLLNDLFEPLSERLVFIDKNSDDCLIKVKLSKDKFQTREKVIMNLSSPSVKNNDEWARVSVSVVNENRMGYQGSLLDIRSYLLLDSELKGQIQTPGLYFVDEDSISSLRKLDLLMLTSGWRNYTKQAEGHVSSSDNLGITFSGKVQKEIANKPSVNTNVFMSISNTEVQEIRSTKTDKQGFFSFDSVVFCDTTSIMIQAKNHKEKNYTRIELNNLCIEHFPINESNYLNIDDIGELSLDMYRLKYINELSLMKYFPNRDSKLLEEVVVTAKYKEKPDNHFRIYTQPLQSKKISDTDRTFGNVLHYLNGRFAGVQVIGDSIIIRGYSSINGSEAPLVLLDGMPIEMNELKFIPMYDIDVVEIIKGPETAIFGFRGANGVISIFTRKGVDNTTIAKAIPGTIIKKIKGFEKFRVFYSPVYTKNNIDSNIPDYRQTLYWNPSIIVDNKTKAMSFFTCDNLTNYNVIVEGITASGQICIGNASFVVDEKR